MNGLLIVNKPLGITSSHAVLFVRKRLPRGVPVGHGGTLDPAASGVLPILIGSATRLFDYFIDKQKTYVAEIQLGQETDTQDATGTVLKTLPVSAGAAEIARAAESLTGDILQTPPMYSAIKRGGKRLYQLARKGEQVDISPRPCRVDAIKVLEKTGENRYKIEISCGKGVYIRTLCHDIGRMLGCGAHMASLCRTQSGPFTLEDARTMDEIDALFQKGELAKFLIPADRAVAHLSMVRVDAAHARFVENGAAIQKNWLDTPAPELGTESVRIYLGKQFAGIGQPQQDGSIRFRCMLLTR